MLINKFTLLVLTIVSFSTSALWETTQRLQADKLKVCTTNFTTCYMKSVIPQHALKGDLNNVHKATLPNGSIGKVGQNTPEISSGFKILTSGVTTVIIDMVIQRIEKVEPKNNEVIINGFPRMWWVDERLAWNPADYGNMTETHYDSSQIWVPDVIPVLSDGNTLMNTWVRWKDVVWVRSDGLCRWSPKGSFKQLTSMKLDKAEGDIQTIDLIWESWMQTEDQLQLDVRFKETDVKNIFHNIGWEFVSSKSQLAACTGYNSVSCFPSLNFEISFKRYTERKSTYLTLKDNAFTSVGTNGLLGAILAIMLLQGLIGLLGAIYTFCCGKKDKDKTHR